MSAMQDQSTYVAGTEDQRGLRSDLREALWLAKQEITHSWPSYPVTGAVMLLFGLLVASTASGTLATSNGLDAFPLDFLFLVWGSFLGTNFISGLPFMTRWSDPFHDRLAFHRRLPIPATSAVAGRTLSVLCALVLNVPAFFAPIYLLSGVSPGTYVWLVGIWLGYALLWTGIWTCLECAMTARAVNILVVAVVFPLLAAIWALEWFTGLRLVARTFELARDFGPLAALASIIAGLALLVLISGFTVRWIGRREIDV